MPPHRAHFKSLPPPPWWAQRYHALQVVGRAVPGHGEPTALWVCCTGGKGASLAP